MLTLQIFKICSKTWLKSNVLFSLAGTVQYVPKETSMQSYLMYRTHTEHIKILRGPTLRAVL